MNEIERVADIFESVKWILIIGGSIVSIILAKLSSKNKKWAKRAEQYNMIQKEILSYIPLAEQFINYEGKDKKEWVLTKVNQFCLNNGIAYDDIKATELLEHAIKLTRDVNKRGTVAKTR